MRIGLFGGTFDPPHLGHLAVGCAAANRFDLGRVLLAPTGRQPLKPEAPTASFPDRLRMTELLCEQDGSGRLAASDVDAPLPAGEPNFTVDTLERLRQRLQNDPSAATAEVMVITGVDAFLELRRWRSPERLLAVAEWIVVSRPGLAIDSLVALHLSPEERARVYWLGDVDVPVSATEVRARLAAGLDCSALVSPPVLRYIRERGLYAVPGDSTTAEKRVGTASGVS